MLGAYKMYTVINTLIPKSDQHLISPFNIIPESNIMVIRIKEMIINWRTSWFLNKFDLLASTLANVYNTMENMHTDVGV